MDSLLDGLKETLHASDIDAYLFHKKLKSKRCDIRAISCYCEKN